MCRHTGVGPGARGLTTLKASLISREVLPFFLALLALGAAALLLDALPDSCGVGSALEALSGASFPKYSRPPA